MSIEVKNPGTLGFLLNGVTRVASTFPTLQSTGGSVVLTNPSPGVINFESGSTPAGTTGSIQFNNAGVLGSSSSLYWSITDFRLGIQVGSSPLAAIHVAETMGTTIGPPATGSASLVAEVACDNPTVVATEITAPGDPSNVTVAFNYELGTNPATTPSTAETNVGTGGFTAESQTINYSIVHFKLIGGLRFVHPTPTTCSYTDTSGDSHTFDVDIGGSTAFDSVTGADGIIITRTGGGTGSTDGSIEVLGTPTTYIDGNFTPTNPTVSGTLYLANGKTWTGKVAAYKNAGSQYRGSYIFSGGADVDANDGTAYWTQIDWTAGTGDGQSVGYDNGGGYFLRNVSIGTNQVKTPQQSFVDAEPNTFAANSLPSYLEPDSLDTASATPNYGGTGYVADGSTTNINYKLVPFRNVFGSKVFANTPLVTTSTDDGSNNNYSVDIDWSGSTVTNSYDGVRILRDIGGGYVDYLDTTGTGYTDSNNEWNSGSTITPDWTNLPTTFYYKAFGNRLAPAGGGGGTYYSTTSNSYTLTWTNTPGGTIVKHTISSPGNIANTKILGNNAPPFDNSYANGRVIPVATTVDYQTSTSWLNASATVTPNHYGFQAGTSDFPRSYRVFTRDQIPSGYIYSSTAGVSSYKQIDISDPGGSAYWTVSGSYADVTGEDGFIIKGRSGGTYTSTLTKTTGVLTFTDSLSASWNSDVDVSNITYINRVGILQKAVTSINDYAILVLRNTVSSSKINSGLRLEKSDGTEISHLYSDSSGHFYLELTGSSTKSLYIGASGSPHTVIQAANGNTNYTTFNISGASNYSWSLKNGSGQFIHCRGDTQRILFNFPNTSESGTPSYGAKFYSSGSSVGSIYAITASGSTPFAAGDMNGSISFRIGPSGETAVGTSNSAGTTKLRVGPGTTGISQIRLDDSGVDKSSDLEAGDIWRNSEEIRFVIPGPVAKYFQITEGLSAKMIPFVGSAIGKRTTGYSKFLYDDTVNRMYLGVTNSIGGKLNIKPESTSENGIVIDRFDSTTSASALLRIRDDSANEMFSVSAAGKAVGTGSGTTSASFRAVAQSAPSSPEEGDFWNDSTQKSITQYIDGVKQTSSGVLATQTTSVTVANTTTETSLVSGTIVGTLTLPANFFVSGKTIRLTARGIHSSTGNPNITIKAKLGSTVIASTGAHASGNGSSDGFSIMCDLTCRTTGGSGVIMGNGEYDELHFGGQYQGIKDQTATINTASSQAVSLTVTWGTANAGNTITCQNFSMEVLN